MLPLRFNRYRIILLFSLLCVSVPSTANHVAASGKIEPALAQELERGDEATAWIIFTNRADLSHADEIRGWSDRGHHVIASLRRTAADSQREVRALLDSQGLAYESFWVVNTMKLRARPQVLEALALRPDVQAILADRTYSLHTPVQSTPDGSPESIAWGVADIHAPEVWSTLGVDGDGIVVATIDTGVDVLHPALKHQYRGNSGDHIQHTYHWFDATGVCGVSEQGPCDEHGHGTHVMGTMVGADRTQAIGVAPGARWIAAKACIKFHNDSALCSLDALLRAGEWMLAPTDQDGANPRPDLRPHVLNNSWGGPPGDQMFRELVRAWTGAGIFTVFSSGNMGPMCQSAGSPGDYPEAYAVGAYDTFGDIAIFSGRGSSSIDGRIKPNIAAPGVDVWSSAPGGGYQLMSGTSMAAPHVSGVVALLWSAAPALRGDLSATRALLDQSAVNVDDPSCGGNADFNNVWGEGRLDALAAVQLAPHGLTATLSGSVRDAMSGAPVAGAEIVISDAAGRRSVVTNQSGRYLAQFAAGSYTVTGAAFGYEATSSKAITLRADETLDIMFTLTPSPRYRLTGVARDTNGRVLRGVAISLPETPLDPVVTDASGTYRFDSIPAGTYTVRAEHGGCLLTERSVTMARETHLNLELEQRVDEGGYACTLEPAAYIEADIDLPLRGTNNWHMVDLPFAFPFYGKTYTQAYITTNGYLSFAQPEFTVPGLLPHPVAPNAAIYPFWSGMFIGPDSSMHIQTLGRAPQRRFVIEWRNVYLSDFMHQIDFEVLLSEQGDIVMQYRNLDGSALERGSTATIGLENEEGHQGFLFSMNMPRLSGSTLAIRYKRPSF